MGLEGKEAGLSIRRRKQTDRRVDKTDRKLSGIELECEWVEEKKRDLDGLGINRERTRRKHVMKQKIHKSLSAGSN